MAVEYGADDKPKKQLKKYSKYNYQFGDVYPGFTYSHKTCTVFTEGGPNVPPQMGWLWNSPDIPGFKQRRGWYPGAVGKTIANMMKFKTPRVVREKKGKKKKKGAAVNLDPDEDDEPFVVKPVLKVKRKGDLFTIEVQPLKDLTEILPNENPFIDCDPLVFKILKKRSPEEQAAMEARKLVKLKRKREAEIRNKLANAIEDICKCAYVDVFCNNYDAIDKVIQKCPAFIEPECVCASESMSSLSSNATWDIEYTPPFGCFDADTLKRKRVIHTETQYIAADAGIPEPHKPCMFCSPCRTCSRCRIAPSCTSIRKPPCSPCRSSITRPKSMSPTPWRCETVETRTKATRTCSPCCLYK